jgi:DNA mismatch repair protein MutH
MTQENRTMMYNSIEQLLEKSENLAGYTLGELADILNIATPVSLKKEKGWIGQLLELALGARAGSKPEQDFPEIGVELKTLPLSNQLTPLESTFVCTAPLLYQQQVTWATSNVRNKLSTVLWVPIIGDRQQSIATRCIGHPWIWQPSPAEQRVLQQDWDEIMELIALGHIETISAHHGQALQLRPKAANGRSLTDAIGQDGTMIKTRPRGFYLRTAFTAELVKKQFSNG